jgi:MFS family permease
MARRAGAFLLATGIVAASCFAALIGMLWGFELKCDDSCSSAPHWRESPESWQWEAFGIAGLAGLGCALVLLGAVAFRLRWLAVCVLTAWAGLAWAFMTLFRDSGLTSNAERGWLTITLLLLAGAVAIVLTPPRKARTGTEPEE